MKTRKINKLLHNNNSSKVVFNDICDVLTGILESNILVISKNSNATTAIENYFDVLNQEAAAGWEFVSATPFSVKRNVGKFKFRDETYQAFIFCKEA